MLAATLIIGMPAGAATGPGGGQPFHRPPGHQHVLELGAAARLTPPPGWATGHHPAMLSTWRDGTSGRRVVEVLTATGERIASTTVPSRPG